MATLYVDGATSKTNPGIGGIGGWLKIDEDVFEFSKKIGWVTNNVAEYQSLIHGLQFALEHNVDQLLVYSDSKLVVNQMKGKWKIKHQDMKTLHGIAKRIEKQIGVVRYMWVPREQNTLADELSKQCLK